jgi:hypothetical protein
MSQTTALKAPPLSNAERQRRWRERLKAKASGAAITDHARDVVARTIRALWAYHERPGPGGMRWADIDGCRTIKDYALDLAGDERGLVAAARAFQPGFEGLTPEEARAIATLIDLADVLALRAIEPDDGIASASGSNGGLLGLLLATDQPSRTPNHRETRTAPRVTKLKLVPPDAPAPEDGTFDIESTKAGDTAPQPSDDQTVRHSVVQRARRRARLQRWK